MIKVLLVCIACTGLLCSPAKAQLLGGAGIFTVQSAELSDIFTLPTLRASVGYPPIPVVFGIEYGTTHMFDKPWYGDRVLTTTGYSLSAKLYRFLGLEFAYNSLEQSFILNSDGIYVVEKPSISRYKISLLIFSRDMSHLSLGYTTDGVLQLGANVQIFGADEWDELIGAIQDAHRYAPNCSY